jgi:hypothetical protein
VKKRAFEKRIIFVSWKDLFINLLFCVAMIATFALLGVLFLIKYP